MSLEEELADFQRTLDGLPTVGQLRRSGDLAELDRLIQNYTEEACAMYEEIHGPR
jgi:hypothetical protein